MIVVQTVAVQPFAVAGLLLDIAGAVILGWAVFGRKPSRAQQEAAPRYNFNVDLHLSLARQTADAKVGIGLLVLGFVGQLLSAAGVDSDLDCWWATGIAVGSALVTVGVAWLWLVRRVRPGEERSAMRAQLYATEPKGWREVIDIYSRTIEGVRPGPVETPAEVGRRMIGDRAWAELIEGRDVPRDVLTHYRPAG